MKNLITILILFISLNLHPQNQWVIYTPGNSGLPDSFISSILIDSNNVKWIPTANGLARLKGNTWKVYDTTNSGIPANKCSSIKKDKYNNLWMIIPNKGVVKFDGDSNWTFYNDENTGLPMLHSTLSIGIDSSNTKWFGGVGLIRFNDTSWFRYYTGNSGIPENLVLTIFTKGNIIWVGTHTEGVGRFDGQNWTTYNVYNSGLPSNYIRMINTDLYNNYWFATNFGGVAKFNYEQNIWTVYNIENSGLPNNNTNAIYIDNNNVKWIGCINGLAIFNDTTWQVFPYSFIGDVFNFAEDRYGNMWIGTSRGLYVYNPNGVIGVENNATIEADNFLFIQNYPNPFNPITKIKYQIPKSSNVLLKVYDILGKEITTLVNEFKKAGTYEIQFPNNKYTINQLPSGIYFVVLKTDNKIKTHKIVLQK